MGSVVPGDKSGGANATNFGWPCYKFETMPNGVSLWITKRY